MSEEAINPSDEVRSFFRNPAIARKVIDLVVKNKPVGWGRRSNAAYFKEEYGQMMKVAADEMLLTRNDCVFFYADHARMSINTVYLMVNQAIRFLVEELDDDNKTYGKWNAIINVTKERNVGIRLSFDENHRNPGTTLDFVKPKSIVGKGIEPTWKSEVNEYLDDDRKTLPLHITGLCLNPDEIKAMRDSLKPLNGIIFDVTSFEIKIIKTN